MRPYGVTSTRSSPTTSCEPREQRVYGARTRGRPAKVFALTDCGRDAFDQSYDKLAADALRWIARARAAASEAVARLRARPVRRAGRAATARRVEAAGPEERTEALAKALSADGYAATARSAPTRSGEQLCQHHCPVAHVAEQFPQLCEAETEIFSQLLGTHVQRLATIAHGDGVCTTFIPKASPAAAPPAPQLSTAPRHQSICKHRREEPRMTLPTGDRPPRARGSGHVRIRLGRLRRGRCLRQARHQRGRRPRHLGEEVRAGVDDRSCASRACGSSTRSPCPTGARTCRASTSTTSSTSCAPRRSRRRPGRTCPRTSRTRTTGSASPRRRSSASSPVSPRSTSPRSSTTRSVRTWRSRASSSWTPTPR